GRRRVRESGPDGRGRRSPRSSPPGREGCGHERHGARRRGRTGRAGRGRGATLASRSASVTLLDSDGGAGSGALRSLTLARLSADGDAAAIPQRRCLEWAAKSCLRCGRHASTRKNTMTMRDLTDDAALLRPVIEALRASGVDPAPVLAQLGLPAQGLPQGRFPHSAQEPFWQACAEACGEEHVGLHLVAHLAPYHGLLLEYLFLSSPTFGDGLRHALRYARLLSDTLSASLEEDGERAVLVMSARSGLSRHFPEMLAGAVIRLFSALTEGAFRPLHVQFMHGQGAPAERYAQVY